MPAQLVENIQYFGSDGLPLVGGQIFVGTVGLEPIGNLITIFSDEDLTVSIANPQTIGADGFSANKIYIPAKYSLRVNTVLGAQFLLDLNLGASSDTGTTSLGTVLGTNAITAQGEANVITSLVDKEVYTLKIANTNTGSSGVTLKIDSLAVKTIVKNFNQTIDAGDFTQNQIIRVQFNSTSDNFAWVDSSVKTKRQTKGSDIASAGSITIPDNNGNVFDITGSATIATINGVAGTFNTFQFDGAAKFTHSASLLCPNALDMQFAAADVVQFYQLTASTVLVMPNTVAFQSVVQRQFTQTGAVNTGSTVMVQDDNIPTITQGDEYMTRTFTPKNANNILEVKVLIAELASSVSNNAMIVALYRDAVTNALAGTVQYLPAASNNALNIGFTHTFVAGTTSLITFRVRAGGTTAGTTTFNGQASLRKLGGVLASSIIVTEYKA